MRHKPVTKALFRSHIAVAPLQAILAACVVLQAVDAGGADYTAFDSDEIITLDDYGDALVYLTLAFIPVTAYFLYTGIRDTKQIAKDQ